MSTEQITAESAVGPWTEAVFVRKTSIWRSFLRRPLAVACAAFLLALVLVAALAPVIAPFDQNYTRIELTNAKPFATEFLLGGDSAGRDILSRLIWASQGTLLACVIVLVVSLLVGVTAGLIAGFFGGWADRITGWVFDLILALPGTVLLIALYTVIGPSIQIAMAVFGVLIAPSYFRLVRTVVAQVRAELYIDAARVSGLSDARIISRHVLVAVRAPVIIQSAFVLAAGIGIQAGLEFLGLGSSRQASWGGILQQSFSVIYLNPTAVIAPTVLISVTTLVLVLLGNALRDVLQVGASRQGPSAHAIAAVRAELAAGAADAGPRDAQALLSVRGLRIAYPDGDGIKEVVHGIDLDVRRGVIHGLVGESGSGKSQTVFSILGILPKEAMIGGAVYFDGTDLLADRRSIRAVRGPRIAYVPQEPMSNLDPTFTVGEQLTVGLRSSRKMTKSAAKAHLLTLLGRVGIKDPNTVWTLYPHQVSGGMAQRILITGAIAADPDIILADEPTTALDVTIQADVLDLLREIREERGLGMIIVTHNLGVVADICDEVSVMKDGLIVERGETQALFDAPQHPYTRDLLAATVATASEAE